MATFMFLTALIQEFSFRIPAELPPPSRKMLRGLTRSPVPYIVRVFPRVIRKADVST